MYIVSRGRSPLPVSGRNENEGAEEEEEGRGKRYHWGFFRVPKDAVI